jgi:hypothetical protein
MSATLTNTAALSGSQHDGQGDTSLNFNRAAAAIDLRNVADPSKVAVARH